MNPRTAEALKRVEKARKLLESGMPLTHAAKKAHVSDRLIRQFIPIELLHKFARDFLETKNRTMVEKVNKLRADGMGVDEACKKSGTNTPTYYEWKNRLAAKPQHSVLRTQRPAPSAQYTAPTLTRAKIAQTIILLVHKADITKDEMVKELITLTSTLLDETT